MHPGRPVKGRPARIMLRLRLPPPASIAAVDGDIAASVRSVSESRIEVPADASNVTLKH
jgi:hypothetical protein